MANEYLTRTPTSSGNEKVWTLSAWIKTNDTSNTNYLFGYFDEGASPIPRGSIQFNESNADGKTTVGWNPTGNAWYQTQTEGLHRDSGNWLHLCIAVDTTKTDEGDGIRMYLNGAKESATSYLGTWGSGAAALSVDTGFNRFSIEHYINAFSLSSGRGKVQYSDFFWVDGQALGPDVFGFYKDGDGYQSSGTTNATDFRPGQWSPHSPSKIKKDINRSGGFGANGFYLPMNDSSNPGADFHMTPNSIITLKGEDLPQPRNGAPTTSDAFVSELRQETGTLGFDGAVKFDGTDDYLSIGDSSDWDIGTAAFTLEGYVLIHSNSTSYSGIFGMHTGSTQFQFRINNVGRIQFLQDFGGTRGNVDDNDTSGHDLRDNKFHHVAMVRKSDNSWQLYVDGYLNYSGTGMTGNITGINEVALGRRADSDSHYLNGFISNFRFVSGTAVYTSSFTPPTEQLTAITNTKLLCCNSSTSATASTITPATITANGGAFATRNELTGSIVLAVPGISGGQGNGYGDYSADIRGSGSNKTTTASGNFTMANFPSYYGTGMRFSGSGNSTANGGLVSVSSHADFTLGTGDFTLEGWIYAHTEIQDAGVFGIGSGGVEPFLSWTNGELRFRHSGSTALTAPFNIKASQWHHVVLQRSSGTLSLIINGVVAVSGTDNHNFSQGALLIGSWALSRTYGFDGDIQDVRLYKGIAKYKGGFDVSKPYTPVGVEAFRTTTDTCKNNFATLNPLLGIGRQDQLTYSEGNLKVVSGATGGSDTSAVSNMAIKGKMYCEFALTNDGVGAYTGIMKYNTNLTNSGTDTTASSDCWLVRGDSGNKANGESGTGLSYGGAFSTGDIIMMAVDIDNSSIWWGRNGSWSASGNPSTNSNAAYTNLPTNEDLVTICGDNYSSETPHIVMNYGQNSTFGNRYAVNKNRINNGTGDSVWHQSSNGGTHTDWTVTSGGTELDVTVPSGNYARVKLRSADGTIDLKKKYLLSFKYTTGPANLGVQDDQGYMTAVDGSASPNGLSAGNFYSFVVHGSSVITITGFASNTYALDNVIVSEIDECYTDASGKGKFHYEVPTGFSALCEDNLPTPAIADPGDHFKSVLYSGDNTAGRRISDVGFKPDMVWIKARNASVSHVLTDSVRGIGHQLSPDDPAAENSSGTLYLTDFADNGFDLGDGANSGGNTTGRNYVAWCWKAGGAAVSNNDGSATSQVSANQDAGFSIVAASPPDNTSVGHGLGKEPAFIIYKARDASQYWRTYHKNIDSGKTLYLSENGAATTDSDRVTATSATTFTYGNIVENTPYIAYCWAEIEGYSKFGSYTGNGSTDGPFVYCGFKPAFVLTKIASGSNGHWVLWDSSRTPNNLATDALRPDVSNGDTSGFDVDLLSNGFKQKDTETSLNVDGYTYIFAAFAESPFQTANAK